MPEISMIGLKPVLGWYCPFSFPVISRYKNIKPLRIEFAVYYNGYIGNVRLCRKLTKVKDMLAAHKLDGLVGADCCNLSHWMIEYFALLYPEIPIFVLNVCRKGKNSFTNFLLYEWRIMADWLEHRYDITKSGDKLSCALQYAEKEYYGSQQTMGKNSDLKNRAWCTLPDALLYQSGQMEAENAASLLFEEVTCPRLFRDKLASCAWPGKNNIQHYDHECVLQSYICSTGYITQRGDD